MKVHEVPFYTLCRIMDPWFKNASPLGHDFFSLWVHDSTLGLQLHLVYNPGPRIYFSMWVHDSTLGLPRYLMYNPGPRKYFSMWFHDSTLGRPWHLVYNHGPRIYFSKWVHDSTLGLPLQVYNWTSCTILDPGFFFYVGPWGKTHFGILLPFCLTLPAWGQYFRLILNFCQQLNFRLPQTFV